MAEISVSLEELFDASVCSVCHKYLSILPVKIYPDKKIKCGRCVQENDNGVRSLYEIVIKGIESFPCSNQYDGCDKWLSVTGVADHELTCLSNLKNYKCPDKTCTGLESVTSSALVCHFLKQHQNMLIMEDGKLIINNTSCNQQYLHKKGNNLYWITGGDLLLSEGALTNISTLQRNGDVIVDYSILRRRVKFVLPLTFQSLLTSYKYQARLILSSVDGELEADIINIALNLELSFDIRNSVAALDEVSSEVRDISIKLGDVNLSERTKNIIQTTLKPVLINILDRTLTEAIAIPAQYLVDRINEALNNVY